jgi:hypothetical protein
MVGRTWTMTAKGLQDLNVPLEEEKKEGVGPAHVQLSTRRLAATVWHVCQVQRTSASPWRKKRNGRPP